MATAKAESSGTATGTYGKAATEAAETCGKAAEAVEPKKPGKLTMVPAEAADTSGKALEPKKPGKLMMVPVKLPQQPEMPPVKVHVESKKVYVESKLAPPPSTRLRSRTPPRLSRSFSSYDVLRTGEWL